MKETEVELKLTKDSVKSLTEFTQKILAHHVAARTELVDKMDIIDRAYTRYKESQVISTGGVDVSGEESCDIFDTKDRVTPPIVVAQVDSYVAYLADVFLSGYPMFPVVSNPRNKKWAEQLEVLLDDHAALGAYPRELLMFLRDAVKYNYSGLEVEWDSIEQFSTASDFLNGTGQKLSKDDKFFNRITRLNPRNIIRDPNVLPSEVTKKGDFAGYVEIYSKMRLKRWFIKMQKEKKVFNISAAENTGAASGSLATNNYQQQPQVSEYIAATDYQRSGGVDWDAYLDVAKANRNRTSYGAVYEKATIYARIIPSDHGIRAPQPNTPQIWKLTLINNQVLVQAHRVISAYDYLPILIGQPIEDGFAEQTQSVAEAEMPFQDAAETLFNIRFAAARRAVSDRALYDSNKISSKLINSKAAAPKIPVNISPLSTGGLEGAYKQIPFDMRGTETTIQDAQTIVQFSRDLHGINGPRMGQFQKGNKSVAEWDDTMAGSDNRMRLPAMTLEYQVFDPMKSMMSLNIFQYGSDMAVVSQKTGEVVQINVDELRKQVLSFKLADGFTPKGKLASVEMIQTGLQMIAQSEILQQAYGASLPGMFAHMMSLAGVRGLEEYDPQYQNPDVQEPNLGAAALQAPPVDPNAGMLPQRVPPEALPPEMMDPTMMDAGGPNPQSFMP